MSSPEPGGPPEFDVPFEDGDVEKRIYGVVLGTREPTATGEIAEAADCDPKTARKYLSWFAELGVVTEHEGRPTTYERNDAYFEWRRVNDLASSHSLEELRRRVSDLTATITEYRGEYGADAPEDVDALEVDASEVEAVYEDLADWATARHERRLYERARQQVTDPTARTHG
jgi:hypothetical protein